MNKFYEYIEELYEIHNEPKEMMGDKLTDRDLDIAKNLFRLIWNNCPGGKQPDGSRSHDSYCINDCALAKCPLKNVVDFDEPRYANTMVSSRKISHLEDIVQRGLVHNYQTRRTCLL